MLQTTNYKNSHKQIIPSKSTLHVIWFPYVALEYLLAIIGFQRERGVSHYSRR